MSTGSSPLAMVTIVTRGPIRWARDSAADERARRID